MLALMLVASAYHSLYIDVPAELHDVNDDIIKGLKFKNVSLNN